MKRILLLAVGVGAAGAGGAACGRGEPSQDVVMDSLAAAADYFPVDSADSVLRTPRLVTEPTVILFWLAAGDTLRPDDAVAIQDDLNYYTERITATLALHGIRLYPTNSDTVFVALPNNQRRAIVLTGLDYPFGYLLIEPDDVERILTGVYDDEALLDEIRAYFDVDGDTTAVAPKITT